MAITNGQTADASDFISTSAGAGSSGKVPKLNASGFLDQSFFDARFGDGSDGNVTISSSTTLTRDMFYNNLTVTSTLTTGNFRIFVKGTISGAGTIKVDPGTTGYFSYTSGSSGGSGAAAGGNAGVAGTNPTAGIGGNGVGGGSGGQSGNGNAGFASGASATSVVPSEFGKLNAATIAVVYFGISNTVRLVQAGAAGGGSGAGTGSTAGGSGGAGGHSGGIVYIAALIWAGTFTIQALGGAASAGSNGANGGTYGGGGGGGGAGGVGGCSVVIYGTKTWTGSYTLTGGAGGGAGSGGTGPTNPGTAGTTGTTGTTGTSYEFNYFLLF